MPARPKKSPSKSTSAPGASKRPTVATLAAEVAELRTLVQELQSRLGGLERGATARASAGVAVATVAVAARPAPTVSKDDVELSLRELLTSALKLALEPAPEDPELADEQFERFSALCHSSRRGTPMLNSSLRTYTWHQMRKNAAIYLQQGDDPGSFEVTRCDPRKLTGNVARVKFFVRARTRMPTPITFARDDDANGSWRIEASSL